MSGRLNPPRPDQVDDFGPQSTAPPLEIDQEDPCTNVGWTSLDAANKPIGRAEKSFGVADKPMMQPQEPADAARKQRMQAQPSVSIQRGHRRGRFTTIH